MLRNIKCISRPKQQLLTDSLFKTNLPHYNVNCVLCYHVKTNMNAKAQELRYHRSHSLHSTIH